MATLTHEDLEFVYSNLLNYTWFRLSRLFGDKQFFVSYCVNAKTHELHKLIYNISKPLRKEMRQLAQSMHEKEGFSSIKGLTKAIVEPGLDWCKLTTILTICIYYAHHCIQRDELFTVKYIVHELETQLLCAMDHMNVM